jgi:hypothetical protein
MMTGMRLIILAENQAVVRGRILSERQVTAMGFGHAP